MSNPIAAYLGLHADALPLREQRMKLIASNLSNADTPGYKAQGLDFEAALSAASGGATGLRTTHEQHLSTAVGGSGALLFERPASQPSLDGNTVDADAERAAYGRAALEYRATLSFVEAKVRTLLTAITGQ